MFLAGAVLPVVGQYERTVVEEATEAIRLRPDFPIAYGQLISAYTALNRFDEARATYALAVERKVHNPFIDFDMYNLAFLQNDTAGMASQRVCKDGCPARMGGPDVESRRGYRRLFRAP